MLTRRVEAETLDHLREDDPRAIRSRRDLRRINRIMGNVSIVDSLLNASLARPPSHIAELGAGDGSLLLRLAKRRARAWPGVTLTLVDRQDLLSAPTRAAFADLGWTVRAAAMDVFAWLEREDHPRYDAIVANLFVHHFEGRCLVASVPRNRPDHRIVSSRASRGGREWRCWAATLSAPSAPTP